MQVSDLFSGKPAALKLTAPARQAARALFAGPEGGSAGGLGQLFGQALQGARDQLAAAVQRAGKSKAEAAVIVDAVLLPELAAHAEELTDVLADLYAAHFSVAELEQLRAFQQTPVGRKAMALMPEIGRWTRAGVQAWTAGVVRGALAKHAEALKRRGVVFQAQPMAMAPGVTIGPVVEVGVRAPSKPPAGAAAMASAIPVPPHPSAE